MTNNFTTFSISGPAPAEKLRESLLFRDSEGSLIITLRNQIRLHPLRHTAIYFVFSLVWVLALTIGADMTGPEKYGASYLPHVALYVIPLGLLIYPFQLIYVPVLSFILLYLTLLVLPGQHPDLGALPEGSTRLFELALALNLFIGAAVGITARLSLKKLFTYLPALTVDLVVSLAVGALLAALSMIVSVSFSAYAFTIAPVAAAEFGITGDYLHVALMRSAYGGVVTSALLVGMLQFPRPSHVMWALPFILMFPALAILGDFGFRLHVVLDAIALAAILTVTLPLRLVVPTLSAGLVIYCGMTGAIVNIVPSETPQDNVIELYAVIALALIVFVLALRAHGLSQQQQQDTSIRRLNTVRNYAGVGVFAVDVNSRQVNVDPVTQRMLGVPAEFDIAGMMRKFGEREQRQLRRLMFQRPGETTTLLARLRELPGVTHSRVIRLFLWYERTADFKPVVYGLVVDVTGEHLQERALKETLAELSMRQDQQKQMFSIISHELRTPASVISMLVDDLFETETNFERVRQRLREATDQLLGVLTDMRQAVNPEKNLPVNLVTFKPTELAESIRNTFEMQTQASGILIRLRLGDGANDVVVGDSVRIKQILGNLIRNAIIHSRCSTITLAYRSAIGAKINERVGVWSITDDGIGIPDEEVERLFQPFQRGGADPRNRADGSGLGLYIVRTAAQLLGGSVSYFPSPDGGAGYHVRLPEPEATLDQIQARKDTTETEIDFSSMYVLLAEDNALVAEVTSARLRKFMGRVDVVSSGREALDRIAAEEPDLVITDLFMPEMSGDELTRVLREDGFTKPIVGLTAAVVGDDMRQFERAGASTIMTKPLDDAALMRFLCRFATAPEEFRRDPVAPSSDEGDTTG